MFLMSGWNLRGLKKRFRDELSIEFKFLVVIGGFEKFSSLVLGVCWY